MSTSTATQSALPALGYDGLKPYAFLSITLVLISYLLYQWALPKPLPGIPYNVDSARKIMGDIPDLLKGAGQPDKTYISYIQKQVAMHKSPIIQLFLKPLGRPMVVISDFRESQDILMRRKEFDRSPFMGELFHGVAPEHHIMKPTNSAWKAQRRLLQDLMSPPFLNNVAGPVIHSSVQNLIRLWSLKSDIAGQRPFSATEDIYSAALDAVFGFAFGENFEYNATSPTVKLLEELGAHDVEELRRTGNASDDSAVEFPKTPRDKAVRSTSDLALALEDINGKPLSQVWWKYVTARTARTRQALKDRDEYIYDELKKAVTRMENKDLTVRSAVDHMIQRETILAQKDGRAPKYLSPVMADEVRIPCDLLLEI